MCIIDYALSVKSRCNSVCFLNFQSFVVNFIFTFPSSTYMSCHSCSRLVSAFQSALS